MEEKIFKPRATRTIFYIAGALLLWINGVVFLHPDSSMISFR